jgi:Mg-chelatase subunit ChlD
MELALATDRVLIRSQGNSIRHLHCALTAPRSSAERPRAPVELALVLDRSGSMGGGKWRRAVAAARAAVQRLDDGDRVAVVVYDDRVDTVLALSPAGEATLERFDAAMACIGPRGATDLAQGWLTGCGLIGQPTATPAGRMRRCLLLTDGLANCGITRPAELAAHAEQLRALGVGTSTFGVGDDYDEHLLGTLADAAGGAFHDIAGAENIEAAIARELGDTLDVVCTDARLVLRWEDDLRARALGPWRVQAERHALSIQLDDLVSGQVLDVLAGLRFPGLPDGTGVGLVAEVWAGGAEQRLLARACIDWRAADHAANDRQPRVRAVDRLVATHYAHDARRKAAHLNRDGDYAEACRQLLATARRIRGYAGDDPELLALAAGLEADAEIHHAPMSAREAKARYAASAHAIKGRGGSGERRRSR